MTLLFNLSFAVSDMETGNSKGLAFYRNIFFLIAFQNKVLKTK